MNLGIKYSTTRRYTSSQSVWKKMKLNTAVPLTNKTHCDWIVAESGTQRNYQFDEQEILHRHQCSMINLQHICYYIHEHKKTNDMNQYDKTLGKPYNQIYYTVLIWNMMFYPKITLLSYGPTLISPALPEWSYKTLLLKPNNSYDFFW